MNWLDNWLKSDNCALNVAYLMAQRLEEPRGVGFRNSTPGYRSFGSWRLRAHESGQLTPVQLEFVFPPSWMSAPPLTHCNAPFLRRERDWHCSKDGWLCIGLPDEWRDTFEKEKQANSDPVRLMDIALTWSLASADSLISRHLYAARYGIEKWPAEWDQWEHFEAGRAAYRKQQK